MRQPNAYDTERARANKERASYLKARLGARDVISALYDDEENASCPNHACGAIDELKVSANGDGWRCDVCGEKGDIVDLVMGARPCGFLDALDFLENECLAGGAKRCARTSEMFQKKGGR